jgi:TonB family protein
MKLYKDINTQTNFLVSYKYIIFVYNILNIYIYLSKIIMKYLKSLPIFFVISLLALPTMAGDKGYVGEEGTEIEVTRASNPAPEYPRRAIRLGLEGSVRLEFDVDTDGSVLDPYVVESSPAGVFDRAAIKAVRKFLYEPPTYNGTSVKVNNVQIDLVFQLAE